MVVGIIVGASIFVQPSEIGAHVPSVAGMLMVWLISGALTLCGALVCAELASALPRTGGVYVFLKETLSPWAGFLWGWAMFWSVHSGIIAATAVILGRYVAYFVPVGEPGIKVVAIAGILVFSGINYVGIRQGSRTQTLVTIAKMTAIAVIVLLFVLASPHPGRLVAHAGAAAGSTRPRELLLGVIAALFTFGGWHMVTYAAGETVRPEKTIPRALLIGTLVVTACYLALNAAYLLVLPLDQLVASQHVAADASSALAGSKAGAAISGLVILSCLGVLNGVILSGPRVYCAMAEDGLAFRWLGAVHPRFRTPHLAIVLQAAWSAALVAAGTYRSLFTRVIYTEWIFFAAMAVGLFRLRRRPGYAPPYQVWGYPVVPVLFILASGAIVLNQLAADPRETAAGFLLVGLGLPVYYLRKRTHSAGGEDTHADH